MNDNLQALYDGIKDRYNLGTFDDFKRNMDDETVRRNIYDAVSSRYNVEDTFDAFSRSLGYGNADNVEATTQANQNVMESITPTAQPTYQPMKADDRFLTDEDKQSIADTAELSNSEVRRGAHTMQNMLGARPTMEQYKAAEQTLFENLDNLRQFDETKVLNKQRGMEIADPLAKGYMSQAEKEKEQVRQEREEMKQLDKDYLTLTQAARDYATSKYGPMPSKLSSEEGWGKAYQEYLDSNDPTGIVKAYNDNDTRRKRSQTLAFQEHMANQLERRARQTLRQAERGTLGDVAGGIGYGLAQPTSWSLGMSDLWTAENVLALANKLNSGEPLTDYEQNALDAYGTYMDALQTLGQYDTRAFKAGQTTGQMAPFFVQMGLNPASGLGTRMATKATGKAVKNLATKEALATAEKAGQALTQEAAERIGQYEAEQAMRQYAEKGAREVLRKYGKDAAQARAVIAGSRIAGDLGAAAVLANTLQAGTTARNVIERKLGDPIKDGENYTFDPNRDVSWAKAFYQGEATEIIEDFTEMMGEWKVMGLADKLNKFTGDKVSRVIRALGNGEFAKGLDNMLKNSAFSGTLFEMLEEEYGILLNSILHTGDGTYGADFVKQMGEGFSLDQQLDILLGIGLFGGMVAGAKMGAYPVEYVNSRNRLNEATTNARELWGKDWDKMQESIDSADETTLRMILGTSAERIRKANENGQTPDGRDLRAVEYISALQRYRGLNIARDLLPGDEDTKTMQEFYLHGWDGADKQAVKSAYEHYKQQLSLIDPELVPILETSGIDAEVKTGTTKDENGNEIDVKQKIFVGNARVLASDYLNAKAAFDGMLQGIQDRALAKAREARAIVEQNDNQGRQIEATLRTGEKVHIIDGQIEMAGGAPILNDPRSSIVVRYEDGKKEMLSPMMVQSIDNVQNTEQVARMASDAAARESIMAEAMEADNSDPIANAEAVAATEVAQEDGRTAYEDEQIITLPDGSVGHVVVASDPEDNGNVVIEWDENPNGRDKIEHISAQDLYALEHQAAPVSETAPTAEVQNTEDTAAPTPEQLAYDEWVKQHGDNAENKMNVTRAYAEEKLSEQESQLAEVNQELLNLPAVQDDETIKKQTSLEKKKGELEASIANYQAVLGQMNSIKSVFDAQNGIEPVTEEQTPALTPEEQRRLEILQRRQKTRRNGKLTQKERAELAELMEKAGLKTEEEMQAEETKAEAETRIAELNEINKERALTDDEQREYLLMTDIAYDTDKSYSDAVLKAHEELRNKALQMIPFEAKILADQSLTDDEQKIYNQLQDDYVTAMQGLVTSDMIEDARKQIEEYQKETGIKMRLLTDISQLSKDELEAVKNGARSWVTYKGEDSSENDEVVFYLPKIVHSGVDLGQMFRHEVLSHHNLKNSMSEEKWNEFLDKVWNVMAKDEREQLDKLYRDKYKLDKNGKEKITDEEYHRLLADEFIATNAQNYFRGHRSTGQKIVDAVADWIRGGRRSNDPMARPILPDFVMEKLAKVQGQKIERKTDDKSEGTRNSVAYHGSGADFDKFDHSFMSTGEGSQVYGWGTYVSTNPETSKVYANISGIETVTYEGEKAPTYYGQELADMMAQSMWQNNKTFEQAKQETLDALNSFAEKDKGRSYDKEIEFISNLKESDFVEHNTAGRMLYTVEIPDDNGENYLHWDKPITDSQSDKIVNALLAMPEVVAEYGEDAEREVKSSLGHGTYGKNIEGALNYFLGDEKNYATGEDPGAERNSKFLNSLGFVGMQVAVDRRGGKRYDGDNYVIYNPDDIQIKDKTRFSIQDEETNDVFNRAIEEYGTTEDSNLAGYMLPDGRYLDFSEGSGMRTLDHRNVGMAYEGTVDEKYEYMNDFMKRGAIRIMPEGGGFELAVAPTFEQKRTLRQFIAERDGDVYVDFLNPDGGNPISAEYYEAEPSRVLADIDRYFNEGVKPISDVRYSIIDEANAKQKQPGEDIDTTDVDVRYSLSKNNRQAITAWLNKNKNLTEDEKRNVMGFIDNLDDPTLQLATGRWYGKGVIRLPEDMDKVEQAVEVARRAKVDPLQYDNPMELINQHADIKIKEKPIDPNIVSTLHKAQEFPEQGIVIYDVDESEESRENMRKIINTHYGEQASPWCLLQGDGKGNLTEDSKNYWDHYNSYPKQVAFKDGKLVAFSANDTDSRVWWDRQDTSHKGIPVADKVFEDGRRQHQMYLPVPGLMPYGPIFRGNLENGIYEEWYPNGQIAKRIGRKNGMPDGLSEYWYANGYRKSRSNYEEGRLRGLREFWYESTGRMSYRNNWGDIGVDGISETWHENGKMAARANFVNGKQTGIEEMWNTKGKMIGHSLWKDGEKVGSLPLTDEKGEPAPGQDVEREEIPRFSIAEESPIRYSLVVDPELYDQLESGEKEKGYRNVTLNEDGTLGSPMAGRLGRANAGSVATSSFELGNWEQSEENPDMADENGKINLIKPDDKGEVRGVNYNPYIHIRPTAVNKQFTQAWNHPELVYIETEYSTSELTSGYKAEKANLPVGRHKWSNGDLILSRYDKPMRIVPWEEVADQWEKEFKKSGVTFDIVPPALLPILAERGVTILPPKKAAQQPAMEAYNQWREEQTGMPDYITDERDGEMISEETPDNTTRFSLSTWENGGREDFIAFVDSQIAAGVLPEDAREAFVGKMDETYKQAKKIYDSGDFETFNEWSDLEVARDSAGNSIYTVIKPNNEYGMNLDFSLVCKKRRTLNAVLNEMIDRDLIKYLGSADGDLSIARINELIRNYGFETACRLCFVDAKRFRQVKVADDFVQLYNGLVNKLIPRGSKIKATFFDFARTGRYTDTEQPLNQQADDQLNISALQKIIDTEDKKKKDEPGRTVTYKIAKHLLENPQDRQYVQREDFMSTRGFGNVKAENRAILGLYNAKKGSGGPKVTEGDVQYLGDVAKAGWSPEEAFKVGGVRIQSFSDYVPHMVFDYIQMVADLAAGKFPAHAYTKEELFAKMFGRTGIKINLSLVPAVAEDGVAPGLDKDGNYVWQENETFPFDEAIAVQNAEGYRENCGTIAVGVSDEQILKMLADEDIRMVIPYHKSGLNKKIAVYNNIDKFTDYTKSQNTRYKDGKKLSKSDAADEPNFNELLQREGDPNAAAQAYLDWCTYHDYLPKFDQFAYDEKGNMRQGYYKLLEDFTTYVPNAEGGHDFYPQRAITLTLPEEGDAFGSSTDIMRRGMQEDEELTRRQEAMVKPIVDEIQKMLTGEEPQTRYSIIGEVGAAHDTTSDGLERLHNLEVARQMESELDPDWNAKDDENTLKIKMATGWERGGDGKWRYEIPDAQFKNGALDKRWGGKTTLGDIVDAPELFAMYPSLKDIKVKRETKRGLDGRYVQGENTMYISTGDYNAYQKRIQMAEEAGYSNYDYLKRNAERALNQIYSTLTHELQHTIQAQEGFARGGSSSMLRPDYDPTELNRKTEEFNRQVDQWNNMSREERRNAHDFSRAIDRLGREIQRERAANVLGLQGYRRLAGETEARNASTRREMTAEQKRNSLLASTEDVARPDQIYIYRAVDNIPAESVRFSVANANQAIFVSNAERAVEKIQQEKATPEQWLAMLQKNGGIKAGEDKWLGLSQWLKGLDGKVSKNQIQEFIAENGIRIEEEQYHEGLDVYDETFKDALNRIAHKESIEELQKEVDADANSADRYDRLGEDADSVDLDEYLMDVMIDRYGDDFGQAFYIEDGKVQFALSPWDIDSSSYNREIAGTDNKVIDPIRLGYTTDGLMNKREIALTIPTIEPWNVDDNIHFGDAGYGRAVVWMRFGDANTAESQRVLTIDEIQSKRHQEGREQGYADSPESVKAKEEAIKAFREASAELQVINNEYDEKYGRGAWLRSRRTNIQSWLEPDTDMMTEEEAKRWTDAMEKARDLGDAARAAENNSKKGIPYAPFDKNWSELAMKRMLRLAAEEGYDYVAWTTGEQQVERYNLAKIIPSITRKDTKKSSDKGIRVFEMDINGKPEKVFVNGDGIVVNTTLFYDAISDKPLSDFVGKDIAVRMMSMNDGETIDTSREKIGGDGMKTFYDQMLVNFMNKYGKQWGVKVEDIFLPLLAEGPWQNAGNIGHGGLIMHSVRVTPEMKASVMEGQTMFSIADNFNDAINELEDDGISIDNKTLLDEYGLSNVTLSKKGDNVTLTHFIVGEQGQGNGTRFMNDLTKIADQNGWTLALTPDDSFGASSVKRLKNFYKRFGFKDNKGRNTNFEINESMVRKPNDNTRYSVATDAEYEQAYRNGDTEAAMQMVKDAFMAKFPNTKVLDENGEPLVMYHGTPYAYVMGRYDGARPFYTFDKSKTGKNTESGDAKAGFFFTPDEDFARYFEIHREYNPITGTTKESGFEGSNLYRSFLNMEKPLDLRDLSTDEAMTVHSLLPEYRQRDWDVDEVKRMSKTKSESKKLQEILAKSVEKEWKYDGIINYVADNNKRKNVEYCVFNPTQIKSAEPFTFDDNGVLIPLSERFNDENNDIRYSFVGENAADALKKNSGEWFMLYDLGQARKMEEQGRSAEWIKDVTGWERGADGKWRYEMEDLELNDDFFEAQTIGEAVKESRLLTAYPDLKDSKVLFVYKNPASDAWYNSDNKEFYVEYSSPAEAAKALAHEIQHYIQEQEGFAEGSSPEFFDEGKDFDFLSEVFKINNDSSLDNLLENIDNSKEDTPKFRAYNSVYTLTASGYTVKDAKAKLISDMGHDPNSFFGKYKRTAGEVKARNVERRMNMSLSDRLATLVSATEDVAREDQIIIFDGAVQEFQEENEPIMKPLGDLTSTRYSISIEPSRVRSEYNGGDIKVYNPRDIADIQAAVMREAYTHKDIRNLNGWDGFMDAAYRMGSNDIVSRAMRNGFNFGEATEQWIFENADRMVAPFEKIMSENNIDLRYSVSGDEIRMYLIKREGLLDDIDLMVMREDLPVEPSVRFSTTGSPSARDLYDASQQSTLNNLYRAYIDYSKPLRDFQAIIAEESGKPIEDFENAWEAENQRSSKSKAEIEKYEITYFEPMRDAVKELQEAAGITYEEVLRYLIAKHGLERNVVLAMRDAEAQYKKYQQEHPTGTKTVDDFFNEKRERDYSGLTALSGKDDVADAEDYALALVEVIERDAKAETDALWEAISDATKAIQKKRYESGLISKQQMENEQKMFNNYIPLRGFAETIAEDVYDYYEDTQRNRPQRDRKAKGRTSLADDPLATIGAMAASAITLGNKNLVKQRFLNMVENHPTNLATVKDVWVVNVGTPTDPVWAPEYPNIHEGMTADEIDQELKDYDLRMDALQNMGMAKKATNKLDIKWRTLGQQAQQHIITIRRGGKEQMVIINGNPQVARTVNGVNNPDAQLSDFMRGVRAVQRFMAANFTTRNPAFVVSNLLRDVGFAVMATAAKEDTAYKRRFMRNISHSLVTITNMGKLIRKWQNGTLDDSNEIERYFGEFMDFGGETGYTAENTVDAYRKKMIQGLKSKNALQRGGETVLDFFELCNRSVEDMTRFTTYLTSRQMGRSVQRSVADAKNITVNFNRKGSGEMCQKYVASAFLFLNAGIQSLQNIAKISGVEFGLDADGKKIKINVNGKKLGKSVAILFGSQVLAGMLIPMLNEMMMGMLGGDDDDEPVTDEEGVVIETNPYRRLTEFERRNNICLWLGGDNFIKIPIAIELRAFYGLGETMYGMMAGMPDPNPGADVVDQMLDLLPVNFIESGGLVPDAVAPLWESFISNKNYQGVPLYNDSEFLENAPEASKVYSNTGDAYIAISRFINELGGGDEVSKSKLDTRLTNPAIMQHIVEGYLGGLLTTSRQTAKLIGQPIKQFVLGQEVEPIPAREWPVVNRLYINTDKRNDDRYVKDRYYFYRDQAEKMRHDERGYLERLDDPKYEKKYNELIESPEYMDYIAFGALNQAVKDAHNVVKELGSEYKEFEIDAMRNLVNALDEESNGIINPQGWGESIRGKDKNNAE